MLQDTLSFLHKLKENNNREWFNQNRQFYEQAKKHFVSFVEELIPSIKEFDSSLGLIEVKDCLFRIYRDIRFSPNKVPYKTNMGAYIARGGRKSPFAGYYFHVEPNASFVSGGIYMAEPNTMRKVRMDIETYQEKFLEIVENKYFQNTFSSLGNESLKRVPQGFSPQSPVAQYRMLKHITPTHFLSDKALEDPKLLGSVVDLFRAMYPLVDFINIAIEQE
jgi:uncharacterized protein (TIGR02453 family)